MGTESESGAGHLDPLANLGVRARWSWRRVERRAVADHEQWLAANLRRLAAARVSVVWAAESAAGQATARTAGIVRLRHRGWQLLLAGVASGPRAELERARPAGTAPSRRRRPLRQVLVDRDRQRRRRPRREGGPAGLPPAADPRGRRPWLGRGTSTSRAPGRIGRSLIDKAGGQALVSAASDSLRLCWRGLLETT